METHRTPVLKEKIILTLKKIKIPRFAFLFFHKVYICQQNLRCLIRYGDLFFFRLVSIETSTNCNRRCYYCPLSKFPPAENYMDSNTFKIVISKLESLQFVGTVYFHFYNEPLLDSHLEEHVRYTKSRLPHTLIIIHTNGDYLTIPLMKSLIDAGVILFEISNHDPKNGAFDTRMEPLLRLYSPYMLLRYKQHGPLSNRGGLVTPKKLVVRAKCTEALRTLQIDYQGNVFLCCNDFFKEYKFGNVLDTDLKTIWNTPVFKKLRKELRKGIVTHPLCRKCDGLGKIDRVALF